MPSKRVLLPEILNVTNFFRALTHSLLVTWHSFQETGSTADFLFLSQSTGTGKYPATTTTAAELERQTDSRCQLVRSFACLSFSPPLYMLQALSGTGTN